MKKAFTLSEALITLAILGVLAAILIPVINNVRPDKDKITYKKALYSMQGAVSNAMENPELLVTSGNTIQWTANDPYTRPLENLKSDSFCNAVAETLNVSGKVSCTHTSSYAEPNFITTDGIRYWGLEGAIPSGGEKTIYVDRNLSSGELRTLASRRLRTSGAPAQGLKIKVSGDGKVFVPEESGYDFENELIESSLQVTAGKQS